MHNPFVIPAWLAPRPELSANAKMTYCALGDYREGEVFREQQRTHDRRSIREIPHEGPAPISELAKLTGLTERATVIALNELKRHKLIAAWRDDPHGAVNYGCLEHEWMWEDPEGS
jgi:hypothetical protein